MWKEQKLFYIYGSEIKCALATSRIFNIRHPNKQVDHSYVKELVLKFETNGSVGIKKDKKIELVVNEMAQHEVFGYLR